MILPFIVYAISYIALIVLEIKTGRQIRKYRSGEYCQYDFKEKTMKRLGVSLGVFFISILLVSLSIALRSTSMLATALKTFIAMILVPNDSFVIICGIAYLLMIKKVS